MPYDLDMVLIEYEHAAKEWPTALGSKDFLVNGDMENGRFDPVNPDAGGPGGWSRFKVDEGTAFWYRTEEGGGTDRFVRVVGGSISGCTVDGGYVQRVENLSRLDTYRLTGRVRCSWPVDVEHQMMVGVDPTGQEKDPKAETIRWLILPKSGGMFEGFLDDPVRPQKDAISVWLRGRTTFIHGHPFEADFDDVSLRKVKSGVPGQSDRGLRER
jgi:hypothetical protein